MKISTENCGLNEWVNVNCHENTHRFRHSERFSFNKMTHKSRFFMVISHESHLGVEF